MQLRQLVADHLLKYNVETLFGLMGDHNMLYINDFIESGGRFVNSAHEATSLSMADGYARFSGRVGVASVTHGPGLTNTLTPLGEACRARTPLVVLTGRTPSASYSIQDMDLAAAVAPFGAGFATVRSPATAASDLFNAFSRALRESRPIVLDIPADLMMQEVGDSVSSAALPERQSPAGDSSLVEAAVGLLASSRRPIVLAGRGAIRSGARDALVQLAGALGAPLATTLLGKNQFVGEELNLGIFGTLSHDVAIQAISSADTIVAFGASLNPYTTANEDLVRGKRLIQVDDDTTRGGRFSAVDVAITGDARVVAQQMRAGLEELGHEASPNRWSDIAAKLQSRNPADDFTARPKEGYIDTREAMLRLNHILPAQRNVITDGGHFGLAVWRYLDAEPGHFHHALSFGSIGLSVATATGAAVGDPSRLAVAVCGDGGFMMNLDSLNTAARNKVPLVVVCVNDRSYGAEYHSMGKLNADPKHSLIDWPELPAVAQALGGDAVTVTSLDELDGIKDRLDGLDRLLLVELRADPEVNLA